MRDGVGAEDDRRGVGGYQLLYEHGQTDAVKPQSVASSVFGDPFSQRRLPAAQDGIGHRGTADEVEESLVLTGERGEAAVLVDGGGAHRHRGQLLVATPAQLVVGLQELHLQVRREPVHAAFCLGRPLLEGGRGQTEAEWDPVVGCEAGEIGDLATHRVHLPALCLVQPKDVHRMTTRVAT